MFHALELFLTAHELAEKPLFLDEAGEETDSEKIIFRAESGSTISPPIDAVEFTLQPVPYDDQLVLCDGLWRRCVSRVALHSTGTNGGCAVGCSGAAFVQLLLKQLDALRVPKDIKLLRLQSVQFAQQHITPEQHRCTSEARSRQWDP